MRRLSVCLLLALASAADAEEQRVISPRADAVSVTIYRDLFAMITETRIVDLPAGPVTLQFDGVVETLIPQSAVITGAGRSLAESNYDFERLTPANLLRHHIGKSVTLMRTNRSTGKVRQVAATVVAANAEGVVFRTVDGNEALACSGLPEQLTFSEIPGELNSTPSLVHPAGSRRCRQTRGPRELHRARLRLAGRLCRPTRRRTAQHGSARLDHPAQPDKLHVP